MIDANEDAKEDLVQKLATVNEKCESGKKMNGSGCRSDGR